jgi:hypothetical protein
VCQCTAKSSIPLVITRRGTHAGTYVAFHPLVAAIGKNDQNRGVSPGPSQLRFFSFILPKIKKLIYIGDPNLGCPRDGLQKKFYLRDMNPEHSRSGCVFYHWTTEYDIT